MSSAHAGVVVVQEVGSKLRADVKAPAFHCLATADVTLYNLTRLWQQVQPLANRYQWGSAIMVHQALCFAGSLA